MITIGVGVASSIGVATTLLIQQASETPTSEQLPRWATLLISLVPTLVSFLLELLVKKGILSKDTKDKVEEVVDDIVEDIKDDGKLNGSITEGVKNDTRGIEEGKRDTQIKD